MKSVTICGVTYRSHKDAATAYGLTLSGLLHRLDQGWTDADFMRGRRPRLDGVNPSEQPITILGVTYPSKQAAAEAFDLSPSAFWHCLNRGWSEKDFERRQEKMKRTAERWARANGYRLVPVRGGEL